MLTLRALVLGLALYPATGMPQAFEVTGKPVEMTWPARDWNGHHAFPPVFCLTYPNPRSALGLTQVMFNRNTLYLARVLYENNTAVYIATSVFPGGRTPAEEVSRMLESNRAGAQAAPKELVVSELAGDFGPTVGLVIRNATEGHAAAPFPFVRQIARRADGTLRSLSVHRLFVRGPDRIEVAGLQYFGSPLEGDKEAEATANLSSLVDAVVKALHSCTASMPVRIRR